MTTNSESEINATEKFSFALVNIGNIPIMTLINSFLLIFYVDIVGLNPIAIIALFLISRIIDGLNDPIMGYIIDHLPNTKWGRFRPYLIIGSLFCSLNYVLLWLGPSMATTGKLIIAYISYILISLTFDLMDIPLNSMIPVMSTTTKDRNSLSGIKGISYLLGTLLISIIAVPIIESFPTPREGYHFLIVLTAIIVFVLSLVGTLGIKERVSKPLKEKYRLKDFYIIIKSRPVLASLVANLLSNVGLACFTAMAIFFFIYVVGISILYSLALLLFIVGGFFGAIISTPSANRIGKKTLYIVGLFIFGALQVLIVFIPLSLLSLIFIVILIGGIGYGIRGAVYYGISADVVDYVDWKQGHRTEAAIASLTSFVTKAAMGIGSALAAYILASTGYVPNVAQTEQAIQGIYFGTFLLPGILILISGIFFLLAYPLTRENNQEITFELSKRREI
ncbi:MAG: MFS transporter [Candidatus Hermodarchaeota archaeon]